VRRTDEEVRSGTLITVAVLACAVPVNALAECSEGTTLGYGCGSYTTSGCCSGDVVLWCENNWACRLSCLSEPTCGWNAAISRYDCGTSGDPAPNNDPPMDCLDHDGDGWNPLQGDCNDSDPDIHPDAEEVCDGIDNNCNANTDEGFDHDLDGYYGDPECPGPLDCDDYHDTVHPGAQEVAYDGIDQDCSGADLTDVDGDGYDGGPDGDDCADNSPGVNPGAEEDCDDGVDNDCDGQADAFDEECGGVGDDDVTDDDDGDDDDDDTSAVTDDDDVGVAGDPSLFEPFGFGCKCRLGPAPTPVATCLLALLALGWLTGRVRR